MELTFERGDSSAPKGHAFIYFRSSVDPHSVLGTYVVVLPIELDLSKYMPPMFASGLSGMQMQSPSAIPMPPLPERMESLEATMRLAAARDDDVVFAGQIFTDRPDYMLGATAEVTQQYVSLYQNHIDRLGESVEALEAPPSEDQFKFMDEGRRLEELVKLTGALRYATEVGDETLESETIEVMGQLAASAPARYRVNELIDAARIPGEKGQRLCELHIQRCYKLKDEQYGDLLDIEMRITQLQEDQET